MEGSEDMSINSRQKGKRGELELASILRELGFQNVRRSQQYAGMHGDADLVGLEKIHVEVKRNEHLNVQDAVDQSVRDAREGELPAVFHRKNDCPWLVTMKLEDWVEIYKEFING